MCTFLSSVHILSHFANWKPFNFSRCKRDRKPSSDSRHTRTHTPPLSPHSVLHFDPVSSSGPQLDRTTRERLLSSSSPCSRSASLLPVNYKCYYCEWRGGDASIHRAIFCHEAKVLYSSSNGDLNSPDSCIHCLVTPLCRKALSLPILRKHQ